VQITELIDNNGVFWVLSNYSFVLTSRNVLSPNVYVHRWHRWFAYFFSCVKILTALFFFKSRLIFKAFVNLHFWALRDRYSKLQWWKPRACTMTGNLWFNQRVNTSTAVVHYWSTVSEMNSCTVCYVGWLGPSPYSKAAVRTRCRSGYNNVYTLNAVVSARRCHISGLHAVVWRMCTYASCISVCGRNSSKPIEIGIRKVTGPDRPIQCKMDVIIELASEKMTSSWCVCGRQWRHSDDHIATKSLGV